MSISPRYFQYMDHFGSTCTLSEFNTHNDIRNAVALRHDVDHDLDIALEMAYWEHERGIRSTYFLLHTAEYFNDPRLLDKALQLQDFGHEVGLHLNFLAQWMNGVIVDPEQELLRVLGQFNDAGIRIDGVSAHGDPKCYSANFINYWMFADLKPRDPTTESGLSAEGVPGKDERFSVIYPESDALRRDDGKSLRLWQTAFANAGLSYHATHINHDRYYSDSGGDWARSPDPLHADLSHGRIQVLMHPIHWMATPKRYFFYSSARSGSKWLARILDKGTSVAAQHEFALNHQLINGDIVEKKTTGAGFAKLLKDEGKVVALLVDFQEITRDISSDYAEVNVYLEAMRNPVARVFPDRIEAQLVRDPWRVVRSIMGRKWYEVPFDTRYRPIGIFGWEKLDPFARCCWYVKDVLSNLRDLKATRCRLEDISGDPSSLASFLKSIGIAMYPRLLTTSDSQTINENVRQLMPEYQDWSFRQKAVFEALLGSWRRKLGYIPVEGTVTSLLYRFVGWLILNRSMIRRRRKAKPESTQTGEIALDFTRCFAVGGEIEQRDDVIEFRPDGSRNAVWLLGGCRWAKGVKGAGWPVKAGDILQVCAASGQTDSSEGRLYVIYYDEQYQMVGRRLLEYLRTDMATIDVTDRPPASAAMFDIAIFSRQEDDVTNIRLKDLRMNWINY